MFSDEVDRAPVVGGNHRGLGEDIALDLLPEGNGRRWILDLDGRCARDLRVDCVVAELGRVGVDPGGDVYAAWDTQTATSDTGWLAWSSNGGQTWSTPLSVTSGSTERLIEVAAAGTGNVYVGWQTPTKGYATYLRRLAVGQGWTGSTHKISHKYGSSGIWPGDTFGLSTRGNTAIVSWGSSNKIWATHTTLPAH
jgi:hypothetical protein